MGDSKDKGCVRPRKFGFATSQVRRHVQLAVPLLGNGRVMTGLGDPAGIGAMQRQVYLAVPLLEDEEAREIREDLSGWMITSDTTAKVLAKFEVEMMTLDDGAGAIKGGVQRLPREGWLGSDGFQNLKREELALGRVGRAFLVVDAYWKSLEGAMVSDL